MTKHEEAILNCCDRYLEDGVKNKYVYEYYKRLTDITLDSTDKVELRDKEHIFNERIIYTVGNISILSIVLICTAVFKEPLILVLCVPYLFIMLQVIGMWNRYIGKLMWGDYSCVNADEWFVDYLVGKGIIKI